MDVRTSSTCCNDEHVGAELHLALDSASSLVIGIQQCILLQSRVQRARTDHVLSESASKGKRNAEPAEPHTTC